MHGLILHNGHIRDAADLLVSPGQVGFLNGWGVFSTLRIYDGVPFAWDRHWERMQRDARRMSVPMPEADRLEKDLCALIDANEAWNATMRVVVVRNRGGMFEGPAVDRDYDVIAFTTGVKPWGDSVRLDLAAHARYSASEFAGAKILSWSENLTRYERAQQHGFDEVVLLNERGEVAECTSANIFVVDGDRIFTPPLSSGCLPGVTRALLLEELRPPGLRVEEKTLFPADMEAASEVLITSTTRELLPVSAVEGLVIRQGRSAIDRLQKAFSEYAGAYTNLRRRSVTV